MGVFHRFLWFFYALFVGILSLGIVAACNHILPESVWMNELKFLLSRQEMLNAAIVLAAVSAYFVLYSLFSKGSSKKQVVSGEDVVVVSNGKGIVNVSLAAVQRLVEREALAVAKVRAATAKVYQYSGEKTSIRVDAQLVLLVGANVSEVSDQVIERIQDQLRAALGFLEVPVGVSVTDISNAPVENKRRVV